MDSESRRQQVENAFDAIFRLADRDGDGVIKRNEFQGMMRCLLQSMADKNLPAEDGDDNDPPSTRLGKIEYSVQEDSFDTSLPESLPTKNREKLSKGMPRWSPSRFR